MLKRFREIYYFRTGKVTYLLLLISTLGIIDSFYDVEGERFFAYLPIIMPGVLAAWYVISIVFSQRGTTREFTSRMYFAMFLAAVPFMLMQIIITITLVNFPFAQNLIIDNYYTHAFWPPEISYQIIFACILMIFSTFILTLFLILIIGLPLVALMKPRALLSGSILDRMEDKNLQRKLLAIVFFSLSSFIVGLIANKITIAIFNAKELSYGFSQVLHSFVDGQFNLLLLIWLGGWIFIGLSIIGIIYAILRFKYYLDTIDPN